MPAIITDQIIKKNTLKGGEGNNKNIYPSIHPFMHNRVKLIGKPVLADMSDLQRATALLSAQRKEFANHTRAPGTDY